MRQAAATPHRSDLSEQGEWGQAVGRWLSTLTGHILCTFPGEKCPQGKRAVHWNLSSRGRVEEGFGGRFSWFASMAPGPRKSLLMLCGTADLAPDSHLRIPPPPPSQGGRKQATIEHLLCAFTRPHALKH